MKELEKLVIDDFEHRVHQRIAMYEGNVGFPKMEDYGVTSEELDDYLFDRQVILDMAGSKKAQYTLAGILIVLPVIILSAFPESAYPWGEWTLFVAIGVGVLFYLLVRALIKMVISIRLRKQRIPKMECYIAAVLDDSNIELN